jgi:hypothetical protein
MIVLAKGLLMISRFRFAAEIAACSFLLISAGEVRAENPAASAAADAVSSAAVSAQSQQTSATTTSHSDDDSTGPEVMLHFWFKDSARGTAVRPQAVLLDGKMSFQQADEAGKLDLTTRAGDHELEVKTNGYKDMVARETALVDQSPMNIVLLDPVKQPAELDPANVSKVMPANGTVILGYVTDDLLARPMPGATVTLIPAGTKVETDANGFFQLPVPIKTDAKTVPDDPKNTHYGTANFKVSKPGFGDDEHLNVLVESGEPKVFQIELVRGGGGNVTDEDSARNNLQSSLFGRYNVEPENDEATSPSVKPVP